MAVLTLFCMHFLPLGLDITTLNSRETIQQSRITLSLDTDRLSLLCPELIGMADQHPWCTVRLSTEHATVGVCLLAVIGLFSSILLTWRFPLTAVRQNVTGLF